MFQSFGEGRKPMRAKPAKRSAGVGVRFSRSCRAALGGGRAANDNARLLRPPVRPSEAVPKAAPKAAGDERARRAR